MSDRAVAVIGLPESGKTTFLAALWHLISQREVKTKLAFKNLLSGNVQYLNDIAKRWREAKIQDRTKTAGNRLVSINLIDENNTDIAVSFPDIPGEAYRRMWEDRDIEQFVIDTLDANGIALFIHADRIDQPQWIVDAAELSEKLGIPFEENTPVEWHPRFAPTQVQVFDLLQSLKRPPLNVTPKRLVIFLSAWDKAEGEGLTPTEYLTSKLPLVAQYLRSNLDGWEFRVYGVSAQGGEFDPIEADKPKVEEAAKLREIDLPSERIRLICDADPVTHDLTEPLSWLVR